MDDQTKELFLKEAAKAFRAQREAADACYAHTQDCLICRGIAWRWSRWFVNFLFECHEVKHLAFDAHIAKVDADDFRLGLENLSALEVPSLEWLDGLYALRDDRSE